MALPRFFVDAPVSADTELVLDPHDVRHAARSLRLKAGEPILVVRGGEVWQAQLVRVSARAVVARALHRTDENVGELAIEVTILQAVAKGQKLDDVVEKCVELGAARIVPVICERSYASAGTAKIERWRRIARSAAEQSRRRTIPIVEAACAWADAVGRFPEWRHVLLAYERAPQHSLRDALAQLPALESVAIAVGPEGGFTHGEADAAAAAGAKLVSLGPTIVRTETAAAAMLAVIASRYW